MRARPACGPFLKWAGGKRQLLGQLRRFYPATVTRYVEPFLGSGAVFFDLVARGQLAGATALLSDRNTDLIGTYLRVRDATDALITHLDALAAGHAASGAEHYYAIRRAFNRARAEWSAAGGRAADYPVELAAMMIYLNRTGFNGLFRLNRTGAFNVPGGRYVRPRISDAERLRAAARALDRRTVTLRSEPFARALARVRPGDFVYLDPPYAPLSPTSSFRHYTAEGFGAADQVVLRDAVVRIATLGARVLLSNSTAPEVVALYEDPEAVRAGLRCYRVPARRVINSRAERRGAVDELVVSNITPTHERPSGALEPDELLAVRTRVGQPEILHERDEGAAPR